MIIDANVLLYFNINHPVYSDPSARVVAAVSRWFAPGVWRSELRNALIKYVRADENENLPGSEMTLARAVRHMERMERVIESSFTVRSKEVLHMAFETGHSPYDCEYVQLARRMEVRFITWDGPVLETFPDVAISPTDYLEERES